MSDDSWELRDLRFHKVPELERRIKGLEQDARIMRAHIGDLQSELRDLRDEKQNIGFLDPKGISQK